MNKKVKQKIAGKFAFRKIGKLRMDKNLAKINEILWRTGGRRERKK